MALLTVRVGGRTPRRRLLDAEALDLRRARPHDADARRSPSDRGRRDRSAHRSPHAATLGSGRAPSTGGFIVALSGRNRLRGYVEEVRSDGLLAQVRLRIGNQTLTAIITGDAVRELKLRRGDDAVAIIKSTEVMIAKEARHQPDAARRRDKRPRHKP